MFFKAPDGAVEQFYLTEDLLHTKIIIAVTICFSLFFLRNDYLFYGGDGPQFFQAVLARVLFAFFSVGVMLFLNLIRDFRWHERVMYLWFSSLVMLCIYFNATRQSNNINFTYLDPVIALLAVIILPGKIHIKGSLAGSLILGDLLILAFWKTTQQLISYEVIGFSYLLALVLGIIVAAKFRLFRYEHYYALKTERKMRFELEKVAYTDYLTGALNRRKFIEIGDAAFARFKATQTEFSVIMLDLDFFKQLNDEFGHKGGDAFLQELARIIMENKRSGDIFGRLGGEEFALILPETKYEYATRMADRLRKLCEKTKAVVDHCVVRTTISVGVTEAWQEDKSFYAVLSRADEALYQAKHRGRNRIQLKLILNKSST